MRLGVRGTGVRRGSSLRMDWFCHGLRERKGGEGKPVVSLALFTTLDDMPLAKEDGLLSCSYSACRYTLGPCDDLQD